MNNLKFIFNLLYMFIVIIFMDRCLLKFLRFEGIGGFIKNVFFSFFEGFFFKSVRTSIFIVN